MCLSLLLSCIYLFGVNRVISTISKSCDNIGTFQQIQDISLPLCAEECFRRQRCQIFMFRHGMNYCALKDQINISSLNENGPLCVYHTRVNWSHVSLGSCSGHNCNGTERCNSKTDTEFECLKSECPLPEKIPNAILVSTTHTVGTTNKYKCINGHAGLGNSTITCNEGANWSVINFTCTKCPAPKQTYFNAVLTAKKGNGYTPGTELTFTCKDGYWKTNDEVKSICQDSNIWEPEDIRCCHENSTTYIDDRCMAVGGSGVASTHQGASEHCKIMGGKFKWVSKGKSKLFSKATTMYVLQNRKMTWFDTNWDYNKCAADNGEVAVSNLTLKEKINTVKSRNWMTKSCYWGRIWADGQPNENTNEACIIFSLQGYKHRDSPCSSQNISFACTFGTPTIS